MLRFLHSLLEKAANGPITLADIPFDSAKEYYDHDDTNFLTDYHYRDDSHEKKNSKRMYKKDWRTNSRTFKKDSTPSLSPEDKIRLNTTPDDS